MKTIYLALTLLLIPPSYAGELDSLAAGLAKAGAESGLNRFAITPFKAADGVEAGRAEGAQREFSRALYAIPGTGVMDAEALKAMDLRGGYWAQVLVHGMLHRDANGETLVLRAIDKRGRSVANLQVRLSGGSDYPSDLRDSPGDPAASACEKKLSRLDEQNRGAVDLKARYWAAMARTPGFSYKSLPRPPGSELREYGVMQEFYRLLNKYYAGIEPVFLLDEEEAALKRLRENEEKVLAECPLR